MPFDSRKKVVVFDCDGVMFDTEKANRIYYNSILKHFKQPLLTQTQFNYVHMSTVKEALLFLFPDHDRMDDVFEYCRTMSYNPLIPHMEMEPYLMALLRQLKNKYKTAIATNRSTTMNAVMDYHGLSESFDLVVTSLDVIHPKPHPEQLLKIMDAFKVLPEEILYIGDSKTDEEAALNADVPFVAYRNSALKARYHIKDLWEITTILASDDSSESIDL